MLHIKTSDQNSFRMLDHNLVGAPFLASEDAVTMDEVFRGAEEEVKRMFTATLTMHCKLVDIFFVAHEKKWLQDGKGLIAAKSVSVVFIYLQFPLTPYKTAVLMPESK